MPPYHLQLVLPELLLSRSIQERKVADVMDEYEPKDGEVRVDRGHLAIVGSEGRSKPLQRRRRRQILDLMVHLLTHELAFEICHP